MQLVISLLVVGIWWLAGFGILSLIKLKLTWSERLGVAWVLGFAAAMWVTFLAASLLGYAVGLPLSLVILLLVGGAILWVTKKPETLPEPQPKGFWLQLTYQLFWVVLTVLTLGATVSHFLQTDASGNWMSVGYTWADLALHQTLAAHFAHQPTVDLTLPIFSGTNLSYPFLTDFASSIIFRLGGSWPLAFMLPTFLSLMAVVRLGVAVAWRLLGSMRAAYLHTLLILASGSAAGWYFFAREWLERGYAAAMHTDWTMIPEGGLPFANLVTSHLLPQRTYLAGFLVFLVILLIWLAEAQQQQKYRWVLLGLLYGGLPFIHVHTFMVVSLLSLCLVIWMAVKKKHILPFVLAMGLGVALAAPQLLWQLRTSYDANFVYQQVGWLTGSDELPITFWLRNLGVALILAPMGFLVAWKDAVGKNWLVPSAVTGLGIFTACNLYAFQPYAWDNMKLLTYWYYFAMLPAAYLLAKWLRQRNFVVVSCIAILLLTASGCITLVREVNEQHVFLSAEDQEAGDLVRELVPVDAVVLTSHRHNHPVTMVAGRDLLVGYPGWLWSYGIEAGPRLAAASATWMGGKAAPQYIERYGITHAVLGPNEDTDVGYTEGAFENYFELIGEVNGWRVFKVK